MNTKLLLTTALLAVSPMVAFAGTTNTNMVTADPTETADRSYSSGDVLEAKTVNGITYVTGGANAKQQAALKALKKDYKVRVVSSAAKESFTEGALVVRDAKGNELLATDVGPIFYANMPKGSYTLELTYGESTQKKPLKVGGKAQDVKFTFKK